MGEWREGMEGWKLPGRWDQLLIQFIHSTYCKATEHPALQEPPRGAEQKQTPSPVFAAFPTSEAETDHTFGK